MYYFNRNHGTSAPPFPYHLLVEVRRVAACNEPRVATICLRNSLKIRSNVMPSKAQFQRVALFILGAAFMLSACNVNVKKNEQGQDKNVDIKTPFGEIHVDKGADVKDTGLACVRGCAHKTGRRQQG